MKFGKFLIHPHYPDHFARAKKPGPPELDDPGNPWKLRLPILRREAEEGKDRQNGSGA